MIPRSVPYEHSPPPRDNIVTVTMPGITSCRAALSRYTGGDPLTVLCNWSDVDPTDPLYMADFGKNRFQGMPLVRRLQRAFLQWRRVVMSGKSHPSDSDEEDVEEGRRWTSSDFALGGGKDQQHRLSEDGEKGIAAAVQEAELGLTDPPVLCNARCSIGPRLLHGVLPSPEVAEVRHRGWYRSLNPMHVALVVKELLLCWWFSVRPFQWCYSEPGRTNTAGMRDQAAFTREVRRAVHHIQATPATETHDGQAGVEAQTGTSRKGTKKHLVLFGVSRGATTCFYSALKLPPELAKHVSLVLVEAPFDTLEHVIDASCWIPRLTRWFMRSFSDWRSTREDKQAYNFDPKEVHLRCPVAFVMSVKDKRVPNACTQALIDRVRRELVPHVIPAVEVLLLQYSGHGTMAVGNKEDQDAYVAFVERLYDTYCAP